MRLFLLLCIWFAIIGAIFQYADYIADRKMEVQEQVISIAEPKYATLREDVHYTLTVVTSFDMRGDSFALKHDGRATLDMLISLNGITLSNDVKQILRGRPLALKNIHGLRLGINELYIQLHPPAEEIQLSHGFQIALKADEEIIFSQAIWSDPSEIVSEIIVFVVEEDSGGNT